MLLFDHDYAEDLLKRLKRNASNSRNSNEYWSALIQHFCLTLRYSRGNGPIVEGSSPWLLRLLIKPLVLWGIAPVVEAVPDEKEKSNGRVSGDLELELLQEEIHLYLALVQAGELMPAPHPKLGSFDVDDWARWHVAHFEHHLKQIEK